MQHTPTPTPLPSAFTSEAAAAAHRATYCPSYSGCLDVSVAAGWENWSCRSCSFSRRKQGGPDVAAHAQARPLPQF